MSPEMPEGGGDEGLSPEARERAAERLLGQAPPGEFLAILADLRVLLRDEQLLRALGSRLAARHLKDHLTPVQVEGHQLLLTRFNDLGPHGFLDPQSRLSFVLDPVGLGTRAVYGHGLLQDEGEALRAALSEALGAYVRAHFPSGCWAVFRKSVGGRPVLVACVENHSHRSTGPWNAAWTSTWMVTPAPLAAQLTGTLRIRAHAFRDANVHLGVHKEVGRTVGAVDCCQLVSQVMRVLEEEEGEFQEALLDQLRALAETLLRKELRRALPITRTTLDWPRFVAGLRSTGPRLRPPRDFLPPAPAPPKTLKVWRSMAVE
ncbi:F-actin-capping protein subunit alpha-3 [Ornithorhynchus anatinus]|uniref:F-actin-capping protein subunit alpha-3 n=1 Tax=Ornithorhynchus anatinus TaxID=9258 RepID=UPI0010A8D711|nr:F-actin-capping protein subunit alpha-3 [Ornithorhynchus anatinus]